MMMSVFLNCARKSAIGEARSSLAKLIRAELQQPVLRLLRGETSVEASLELGDQFVNRFAVGFLVLHAAPPRDLPLHLLSSCHRLPLSIAHPETFDAPSMGGGRESGKI